MKIMSILLNKSFQIPLKGQGEIFFENTCHPYGIILESKLRLCCKEII